MKSAGVAYALWLVGPLTCGILSGLHRFYLDRPATGILWLLTFGVAGVGTLIDLLLIPSMVDEENGRRRRPSINFAAASAAAAATTNVTIVNQYGSPGGGGSPTVDYVEPIRERPQPNPFDFS